MAHGEHMCGRTAAACEVQCDVCGQRQILICPNCRTRAARGYSSIGSSTRSDVSSSQLQAARFARGEARYASGKGAAKPDAGHAVSNIGGTKVGDVVERTD